MTSRALISKFHCTLSASFSWGNIRSCDVFRPIVCERKCLTDYKQRYMMDLVGSWIKFFSVKYLAHNLQDTASLRDLKAIPEANMWKLCDTVCEKNVYFTQCSCNIPNTINNAMRFHPDIQTPRRELKKQCVAEYFWRNSRWLDSRWNTVSSVWYIFSIETKTKE